MHFIEWGILDAFGKVLNFCEKKENLKIVLKPSDFLSYQKIKVNSLNKKSDCSALSGCSALFNLVAFFKKLKILFHGFKLKK